MNRIVFNMRNHLVILSLLLVDLSRQINTDNTCSLGSDTCEHRDCTNLATCLNCPLHPDDCTYGSTLNVQCTFNSTCANVATDKNKNVTKTVVCQYCYQTPRWQHRCTPKRGCDSNGSRRFVNTTCTVDETVVCMGSRAFHKRVVCNWTSGHRWSTTLALSVTLGGFGADRFYLGLWKSGIGKLVSFGGLGVWTLIDVVLIAVGYVTPSDGSVYIY